MSRLGWGAAMVGAVAALAALGPLVAPAPPVPDPVRAGLLPPGTSVTALVLDDGRTLSARRVERTPAGIVVGGPGAPVALDPGDVVSERRFRHWLGTDRYGRDVLRQLMAGGRLSLAVAGLAAAVAVFLGTLVGLTAASAGPLVDGLLMRAVDALLAFPVLFLMILAATLLRPGVPVLVLVLGLTSWMGLARLVRGQVLSLRTRPFVLAARAGGTPEPMIWRWHYLPNLAGPVSQDVALRAADLVVAEATLSYLGLGLPPTAASWGALVQQGQRSMLDGWWLATLPGVAIVVLVVGLTLIGDGIQERLGSGA